MSESMIERVAIAIATSHLNDPPDPVCVFDFYALTGVVAEKYYAMARAAIEAMLSPTNAMYAAANDAFVPASDAAACWHAMIDAALQEDVRP